MLPNIRDGLRRVPFERVGHMRFLSAGTLDRMRANAGGERLEKSANFFPVRSTAWLASL